MTLSMIAAFLVAGSWTTCVAVKVGSSKKLLTTGGGFRRATYADLLFRVGEVDVSVEPLFLVEDDVHRSVSFGLLVLTSVGARHRGFPHDAAGRVGAEYLVQEDKHARGALVAHTIKERLGIPPKRHQPFRAKLCEMLGQGGLTIVRSFPPNRPRSSRRRR